MNVLFPSLREQWPVLCTDVRALRQELRPGCQG